MPCKNSIHAQIGDVTVCVHSDSSFVRTGFAHLYPISPASDQTADDAIHMEVRQAGRSRLGRRLYRVFGDGEQVGGLLCRREVFPFLEWGINLRVIERYSQFLQLHAASMVHLGHGCILAGSSGCGKSTLSAALLSRGWGYLSDEFALIDPKSLLLHSFPKALCIKAGSFDAIGRIGLRFAQQRHHIKGVKGRVGYLYPNDIRPGANAVPVPIRYLVFPKFVEGARPELFPVTPGHALVDLAGCVFNRHRFAGDPMAILAEVIRGAECFHLHSGDLARTCALLESQFNGSAQCESKAAAPSTRASALPRKSTRSGGSNFTRREALRLGAKLAYVAPAVVTLSAHGALSAGSNPSDICSAGVHTGHLCETDTDCCSRRCDLGVCHSNQ